MVRLRAGSGVLRHKPIEHIEEPEGGASEQLTRVLGLWQLTAIGIGGIIGAGIFTLAGTVANGTAGPAVVVSFLIAGIASAAAAFSYAEFAGLIPKAGSAYTYGYAVFGELPGWFIGWDLLLEYTAIVAVVAIGVSGYFSFLLGDLGAQVPAWMLGAPGTGPEHKVDLFAVALCLLIACLLNLGIKNAARFETAVVALKVAVVLLVIVVGVLHINTGNYTPFFPYGLGGAATGAATVFFAVFGYDAMSTAAEESTDSMRHMPKAIVYSLAISMVLYVLACLVLTGVQNYTKIDKESGFSTAFQSVGLTGLADVIALGALRGVVRARSGRIFRILIPAVGAGQHRAQGGLGLRRAWAADRAPADPGPRRHSTPPRRRKVRPPSTESCTRHGIPFFVHHPTPLRPPLRPAHEPAVVGQCGIDPDRVDRLVGGRIQRGRGVRGLVRVETEKDHRARVLLIAHKLEGVRAAPPSGSARCVATRRRWHPGEHPGGTVGHAVRATGWSLIGRSARPVTFSLRYTRVRCCSTVLTEIQSRSAISRFEWPRAAREATRRSAVLSC
jgi:Amino acid permease